MSHKNIKIKICGITEKRELDRLKELEADYAGFVLFFEKSRRNNTIEWAEELTAYLKKDVNGGKIPKAVAVTVSPTAEQVEAIERAGFDILQVHGILSLEVKEKCHLPIWRAFNIAKQSREELEAELEDERIEGIVLDGAVAGSGKVFSWENFRGFDSGGKTYVLAGGLQPENVQKAIESLAPDVVDVSSGVEYDDRTKKGKDLEKISRFVEAVRRKEGQINEQ